MKTLTTQKLIVWSEFKYVWVTMLKAFFLSNNKMKSWPLTDLSNATIDFRLPGFFSSFIVKKVTKRHNRTLLVWYAAPVHFLLETNNASLHGIVRNQDKVSCQAHETLLHKQTIDTRSIRTSPKRAADTMYHLPVESPWKTPKRLESSTTGKKNARMFKAIHYLDDFYPIRLIYFKEKN